MSTMKWRKQQGAKKKRPPGANKWATVPFAGHLAALDKLAKASNRRTFTVRSSC
jgi:hypothetical protein